MNKSAIYPLVTSLILFMLFLTACNSVKTGPLAEPTSASESQQLEAVQVLDEQVEETTDLWPEPRIHPSMIYDPASQRIFMFSGLRRMSRRDYLNEVWAFDTTAGSWESLGEVEPDDSLVSFGFDEESGRVVSLNNSPRETWAYILETGAWEKRQPSKEPLEEPFLGRRFGAPMAYDAESDRLILFGGGAPELLFSDTWAYDYNKDTWEEMQPSISPSPRGMAPMVYDAESDRVILWGGFMEPDVEDAQIWAYDYNSDSWESLENVDGPQAHWERGGMAYLPELDRILFFTGMREYEDILVGPETWYYDYNGNSWTKIETEISPPAMAMYSMAYDPSNDKVIVFGGELESKYAGELSGDIWFFDPMEENWSQVTAPTPDQG